MGFIALVCWLIVSIIIIVIAICLGGWKYALFLLIFAIFYLYVTRNDNNLY